MAAFPAILCRCGITFSAAPLLQAICAALCLRPFSTTAAFPAILCRCLCGIVPPSLFHNGSISRDSLPLRHRLFGRPLSTGLLRGIVLPLLFHNGSKTCDSLPLRNSFFRRPLAAGHRPFSTTAAFPAILCRCGTAFSAAPSLQAFCAALSFRSSSTTAAFPAIHCRCGTAFSAAPSLQVLCAALCRRPFSTTAAFPAILCRCGEVGTFLLSLLAEILNE